MKAFLFRFVAVLISLLLVALFAEAALRIFAPGGGKPIAERVIFCRFDHELGWVPLENLNFAEKRSGFVLHQNQFGLRGPDDMHFEKTPGKKRVLVLGDSYVWGVSASQDDIFTDPKAHGTNDEFINCGVSGYGTDQEYLFYLRVGQRFDVDQVVLVFTPYNDVANNLASKQYSYLKPYFTLSKGELVLHNDHVQNYPFQNFIRRVDRECRVWNLVTKGLQVLGHAIAPKQKEVKYAQANFVVSDADKAGIELTLAIIKKLKEAVAARGAEFYVVFIPFKKQMEKHLPGNHPFVPLLAAGLTQMGVDYREPYPEFYKAVTAGAELFHPPDNHFNAAGHALFAKFVTDTDLARASTNYYAHQ
ncbi:MAG TPA: SGNH/GDSL hydrolase family protein [Chthoniobacterales bacterium]